MEINKSLKILNLSKKATLPEVKSAYRKLVLKYHPDRCKENRRLKCIEKFIKINNARKILRDYYTGNYKPVSRKRNGKKKIKKYKEHIDHVKRFYGDWGDLDF